MMLRIGVVVAVLVLYTSFQSAYGFFISEKTRNDIIDDWRKLFFNFNQHNLSEHPLKRIDLERLKENFMLLSKEDQDSFKNFLFGQVMPRPMPASISDKKSMQFTPILPLEMQPILPLEFKPILPLPVRRAN
jgi:hypothetical protein